MRLLLALDMYARRRPPVSVLVPDVSPGSEARQHRERYACCCCCFPEMPRGSSCVAKDPSISPILPPQQPVSHRRAQHVHPTAPATDDRRLRRRHRQQSLHTVPVGRSARTRTVDEVSAREIVRVRRRRRTHDGSAAVDTREDDPPSSSLLPRTRRAEKTRCCSSSRGASVSENPRSVGVSPTRSSSSPVAPAGRASVGPEGGQRRRRRWRHGRVEGRGGDQEAGGRRQGRRYGRR